MTALLPGLVIAAASWLGLAADDGGVRDAVGDVLSDRAYAFCHDPEYPLLEEEARWCPLLEGSEALCPTYQQACDAPRGIMSGGQGPFGSRRAQSDDPHEEQGPRPHPSRSAEPEPSEPSPIASWLATVLLWTIVAAMAFGVVMAFVGQSRRGRRHDAIEPTEAREDRPRPVADVASRQVETDVQRLLDRAQAKAGAGDYDGAVADTHAAMLRHLEAQGRIHIHSSRTNGDYVAQLGDEPTLVRPVEQVVSAVERVQFGRASSDRAVFERVSAAVRALLGATSLVLLLVLLGSSISGCDPRRQEYPWETSPSGYRATFELLKRRGIDVGYRSEPLDRLDSESATVIVLEDATLDAEAWRSLMRWVDDGGQAVLCTIEGLEADIGVWHTDAERSARMRVASPPRLGDLDVAVPGRGGLRYDYERVTPVLLADDGVAYAVAIGGLGSPAGDGRLIVLADEQLLHSGSLPVADNAAFLVALLDELDTRVELVDVWLAGDGGSDMGSDNPFEAIERANLTPLIVQVLLMLVLLYAWRGVHFGRPRDPPPALRRSFCEHARALAQQYARANATRHALRLYATWALDRLQERMTHGQVGLYALAQRVAARTGRDETEIMRVLVEAHGAREGEAGSADPAGDLRLMRELGELIEATGARR